MDRQSALAGMRRALDSYVIRGVRHNATLLRSVLDVPQFVEGDLSTAFLAQHYPTPASSAPDRLPLSSQQADELLAMAAMLWVGKQRRLSSGGDVAQVQVRGGTLLWQLMGCWVALVVVDCLARERQRGSEAARRLRAV